MVLKGNPMKMMRSLKNGSNILERKTWQLLSTYMLLTVGQLTGELVV